MSLPMLSDTLSRNRVGTGQVGGAAGRSLVPLGGSGWSLAEVGSLVLALAPPLREL